MQAYLGTKLIKAQPLTRLEYNLLRGWDLPADENGSDAGFLVEYVDGGKANHPNYAGYISWSPADVFARAYQAITLPANYAALAPHQQRVALEKAELDDRQAKLGAFVGGNFFVTLPEAERARLRKQHRIMSELSEILRERIAAFEEYRA